MAHDLDVRRRQRLRALERPRLAGQRLRVGPLRLRNRTSRARLVDLRNANAGRSPPAWPEDPARWLIADDVQLELRRPPLSVCDVVPRLGFVVAGLEVRGVRAAGDVDNRRVRALEPSFSTCSQGRLLGVDVLRVHREIGPLEVDAHAELDHFPVTLVQADPAGEVVVVEEVVEPVLEPEPPPRVLLCSAIHAVAVARKLPQGYVHRPVVTSRCDDHIILVDRLAVCVLGRA